MKKFYTLAAAAVLAMSANAQLFVCGDGEGIAWTPDAPMEVALVNGSYTFDINNLSMFKISTTFGDWDTFNGGAKTATVEESNLGSPVALVDGDVNIMCPWIGNYHIVVAGDLSTITMTTTTPKPVGFKAVYLRGGMNDWGAPEAWRMETSDGITYWFDCVGETAIPAATEFKIADAGWAQINYGAAGIVAPDEEFPNEFYYNGNNSITEEEYTGTIKAVLPEELGDGSVMLVYLFPTIVEHGGAGVSNVNVDANAPAVYYNLQGVEVINPANGLFIKVQGNTVTKVLVK